MNIFNSRGNVPAMILVTVLVLASVLVANIYFSPSFRPVGGSPAVIRNDVQFSAEKALTTGIDRLMRHGDSNHTQFWYCNEAIPPSVDEVIESSEFYFKDTLQSIIEELEEEQNINIRDGWSARLAIEGIETNPNINPQIYDVDPYLQENLPDDGAIVRIQNLFGTYQDGETTVEIDLSGDVEMPYRIWYFYKKLATWMNEDAAGLSIETCNWLNSGPCQLTRASCQLDHLASAPPIIPNETIQGLFPTEYLVNQAIQTTVNGLNAKFEEDGANITCTYTVLEPADPLSDTQFQRLQRCIPALPTCSNLRTCGMFGLDETYSCPDPVCNDVFPANNLADLADDPEQCAIQLEPPRENWLFSDINDPTPGNDTSPIPPDIHGPPLDDPPGENPNDTDIYDEDDILVDCPGQYKEEYVTIRPEGVSTFLVECTDYDTRVLGELGDDFLKNTVRMRIALKLNCECEKDQQGNCIDPGYITDITSTEEDIASTPTISVQTGELDNVFRNIPCSSIDPVACTGGPGGDGDGGGGGGPGPGPGPDTGPQCPPCDSYNRPNGCYYYECNAATLECEPTTDVICGESNYCYEQGCFKVEDNQFTDDPCTSNNFNESCACNYEATPENVACYGQSTPCTSYYCDSWNETCTMSDSCQYSNACQVSVCQNEGSPQEACIYQPLQTCDGDDGDPCTWDWGVCQTCYSGDGYCTDEDQAAGWTCHKLKCSRDYYLGCEADPSQGPDGYRCIEPTGGG